YHNNTPAPRNILKRKTAPSYSDGAVLRYAFITSGPASSIWSRSFSRISFVTIRSPDSTSKKCPLFISKANFTTSPGLSSFLARSEEHTSELQSRFDLVCRLLLEKKMLIRRLKDPSGT